jgi:hypothetical protein
MMKFYNWLVCKLFKQCQIDIPPLTTHQKFKEYCKDYPHAGSCKIYDC